LSTIGDFMKIFLMGLMFVSATAQAKFCKKITGVVGYLNTKEAVSVDGNDLISELAAKNDALADAMFKLAGDKACDFPKGCVSHIFHVVDNKKTNRTLEVRYKCVLEKEDL